MPELRHIKKSYDHTTILEDITNVSMEKRGFNIVFQDYALFPNLNV